MVRPDPRRPLGGPSSQAPPARVVRGRVRPMAEDVHACHLPGAAGVRARGAGMVRPRSRTRRRARAPLRRSHPPNPGRRDQEPAFPPACDRADVDPAHPRRCATKPVAVAQVGAEPDAARYDLAKGLRVYSITAGISRPELHALANAPLDHVPRTAARASGRSRCGLRTLRGRVPHPTRAWLARRARTRGDSYACGAAALVTGRRSLAASASSFAAAAVNGVGLRRIRSHDAPRWPEAANAVAGNGQPRS